MRISDWSSDVCSSDLMICFFALQAPFTGGEDGIQAIPRGDLFGVIDLRDQLTLYYFVLAVFAIGWLIIYRTIHSPFGQVLKAIRENEPRAISLGYRTDHSKLIDFVLSAALSGLAGRSEERRVGKEGCGRFKSRWWPYK